MTGTTAVAVVEELTQMEELFCLGFVLPDMRASQAARMAGYKIPKDAAQGLLGRPRVIARIRQLRKLDEKKTISTRHERLEILTEIERARFSDFMNDDGTFSTEKLKMRTAGVQEVKQRTRVSQKGTVSVTITTLKLRDPIPAVAEHNKMAGDHAPTKHQVAGRVEFSVSYEKTPQQQLEEAIEGEVISTDEEFDARSS